MAADGRQLKQAQTKSVSVTIICGRVYRANTARLTAMTAAQAANFHTRWRTQAPCGTGVRWIGDSRTGRFTSAAKMPRAMEIYQTMS